MGGQSKVGTVTSLGPVQVDGGAIVAGNIVSGGSVQIQAGAVVEGDVLQNQVLSLPTPPTVPGEFSPVCGGPARYNADTGEHTLEPGCYSELQIGSRTTVVFRPGTYSFERVTIEPDAVLVTAEGLIFDVKSQFSFRGRLESPAGGQGYADLRFRSTGQVLLEAPFYGLVLAPEATLVMGGTNGQVFSGKYYAKHVEVRSGIKVIAADGLPSDFGVLSFRPRSHLEAEFTKRSRGGCSAHGGTDTPASQWALLLGLLGLGVTLRRRAST